MLTGSTNYGNFLVPHAIAVLLIWMFSSCHSSQGSNTQMADLLASTAIKANARENEFAPAAKIAYLDSILNANPNNFDKVELIYEKASAYLKMGDEAAACSLLETMLKDNLLFMVSDDDKWQRLLALAYMRAGEKANCIAFHSTASCVFPIKDGGIHLDKTGSSKAIEIYEMLLAKNGNDPELRWLLNIAYMTLGKYPSGVPPRFLIPGLDSNQYAIKPFVDVAGNIGLNTNNMGGGSIIDDFDNDGYFDLITSSWSLDEGMRYCRNKGNSSFEDVSESSGLKELTGGLNIMQTDYNNDGLLDVFVLRGAWKSEYGKEPNSLLRNNGDGSFTDVTKEAGLLSFHPTQTATWNDFNNDGWLDVFIGNESKNAEDGHTCELYINNGNGTFTNQAVPAGVNINAFVKGVTSGDYDKDGWPDLFISTFASEKILLKNDGLKNGSVHFTNVTSKAGLDVCKTKTFATWFWDYDNDGWLDLFVAGYDFFSSLAEYATLEAIHFPIGNTAGQFLFKNNRHGGFENVADKVGLNRIAFAMGANFGDIDNDGYLDIFLGTGNPKFESVIPNKLFKNEMGLGFTDLTSSARVGSLQKGHGVSFADLDNDGDEDIHIEMGGAYPGDAYQNSLFINPGESKNNCINISLEGVTCNRAAIGAVIKLYFTENGQKRMVCRQVNSGGSFGSNPLRQHIGIGKATFVERLEIEWPVSRVTQVFNNLEINTYIKIKEGNNKFETVQLKASDFSTKEAHVISCGPPR